MLFFTNSNVKALYLYALIASTSLFNIGLSSTQFLQQSQVPKNPFSAYTTEVTGNLTKFDYAKQTQWLADPRYATTKTVACSPEVLSNPEAAVNCFLDNNTEYRNQVFSFKIPEHLKNAFQNQNICRTTTNVGEKKLESGVYADKDISALNAALEKFVGDKIRESHQDLISFNIDPVGDGDTLNLDTSKKDERRKQQPIQRMNHFYRPRDDIVLKGPFTLDEFDANAGPQAFHQDRSSLADGEDSKNFLMLYTACDENLDDARSGTWISSATKEFFQDEKPFCTPEMDYTQCWSEMRDRTRENFGPDFQTPYESGKFRAPRFTQGDDWTKLQYIDSESENQIRNLKKFQQIPSKAGHVLVILETEVMHAGPEVLPISKEKLTQMKRVVVRRRFLGKQQYKFLNEEKQLNDLVQGFNESVKSEIRQVLNQTRGDIYASFDLLLEKNLEMEAQILEKNAEIERKISQLMGMGFKREDSERSLSSSNGDVDAAVNMLLA